MFDSLDHPLRVFRKANNLSLEALAQRAGTTKSWLSRIEAGEIPSTALIARLVSVSEGALTPNDFFVGARA